MGLAKMWDASIENLTGIGDDAMLVFQGEFGPDHSHLSERSIDIQAHDQCAGRKIRTAEASGTENRRR